MTFTEYTEALDTVVKATASDKDNIETARETVRSVVHWTAFGRRVTATANANTQMLFQTEGKDEGTVERWSESDDLSAPQIEKFARMIVAVLEDDEEP